MKSARRKTRPSLAVSASADAPRGRFADLDADKLRGGYYTSPQVARWLCDWAIHPALNRLLAPVLRGLYGVFACA